MFRKSHHVLFVVFTVLCIAAFCFIMLASGSGVVNKANIAESLPQNQTKKFNYTECLGDVTSVGDQSLFKTQSTPPSFYAPLSEHIAFKGHAVMCGAKFDFFDYMVELLQPLGEEGESIDLGIGNLGGCSGYVVDRYNNNIQGMVCRSNEYRSFYQIARHMAEGRKYLDNATPVDGSKSSSSAKNLKFQKDDEEFKQDELMTCFEVTGSGLWYARHKAYKKMFGDGKDQSYLERYYAIIPGYRNITLDSKRTDCLKYNSDVDLTGLKIPLSQATIDRILGNNQDDQNLDKGGNVRTNEKNVIRAGSSSNTNQVMRYQIDYALGDNKSVTDQAEPYQEMEMKTREMKTREVKTREMKTREMTTKKQTSVATPMIYQNTSRSVDSTSEKTEKPTSRLNYFTR